MNDQITNFRDKRVTLELVTGTRLMGTIHWIQGDGSTFGISDSGRDDCDVVATAHLVRIKEFKA